MRIHPTALIDASARLAADVEVGAYSLIGPHVEIGAGSRIGPHAVITGHTRIGNDNWIMAYVHLAHDCQIGNYTVFANNAQLAGHVQVGDYAILGGYTGVHQFCRIGAHVITSIGTHVLKDVPPFVTASGSPASPYGINSEGLKRRGYSGDAIAGLKRAYKTIYRSGDTIEQALAGLGQQVSDCPEVQTLIDFLAVAGRGIIR